MGGALFPSFASHFRDCSLPLFFIVSLCFLSRSSHSPLFSVAISLRYRDSQLSCFIAVSPLVIKDEEIARSAIASSESIAMKDKM